jgi:hypothetical protein
MELFGGGLSKAEKERDQNTSILELYLDPPEENITLQEFESIAKTRQRSMYVSSHMMPFMLHSQPIMSAHSVS